MSNIKISHASAADVPTIHRLAHEIWWPAYGHFIPHGQISLMLEKMYSEEALLHQIASGGLFLIACLEEVALGFAEYRPKSQNPAVMRIEKLYVDPHTQGRGVGCSFIAFIGERARETGRTHLELNVNRNNENAIAFYQKNGFVTIAETDTPYHGYVLDDYVMQKDLSRKRVI